MSVFSTGAIGGLASSSSSSSLQAKDLGVKGDGITDDTAAINAAWVTATAAGKGLDFLGTHHKVSKTIRFGGGTGGHVTVRGIPGRTFFDSSAVPVVCTASISGYVLTVTAIASGGNELGTGCVVNTPGGARCTIRYQQSGTTGGTGAYLLDATQTIASAQFTIGCPVMLIGNGTGVDGFVGGDVSGFVLSGPAANNTGVRVLCLSAITDMEISQMAIYGGEIGIDAVENCFGFAIRNSQAGAFGTCAVGCNIQGGATGNAGNQVELDNCWFTGTVAGSIVGPDTDGITIIAGQMGCTGSTSANSDTVGANLFGLDYLSGRQGGLGTLSYDRIDTEQFDGWAYRGFGQAQIEIRMGPVLSKSLAGAGQKSVGVLKWDNAHGGKLWLQSMNVSGLFSAPNAIVVNDTYSGFAAEEINTIINLDSTFSGGYTPSQCQSLFVMSNIGIGRAWFRDILTNQDCFYFGGVIYKASDFAHVFAAAGGTGVTIDGTTRVASTAAPYQMLVTDRIVSVNKPTGAQTALALPIGAPQWVIFLVSDTKGDAGTNNITLLNIDGSIALVISSNFAAVRIYLDDQNTWRRAA